MKHEREQGKNPAGNGERKDVKNRISCDEGSFVRGAILWDGRKRKRGNGLCCVLTFGGIKRTLRTKLSFGGGVGLAAEWRELRNRMGGKGKSY